MNDGYRSQVLLQIELGVFIVLSATKIRYLLLISLTFYLSNIHAQAIDYSLPGLMQKVFNYHPLLKSSVSLQASAKHGVEIAKWQYFPTPSVLVSQINTSKTDANYSGDDHVIIMSLSQPLWAGGGIDAGLEKSRIQLEIKQIATLIVKQDLALNLIRVYASWYSGYLKQEAFSKSKKEYEFLQKRIQRRIKQGLSSGSELILVSSRLLQVEAKLNSATIHHQGALLQLQELVGEVLDAQTLVANISHDYIITGDQVALLTDVILIDPKLGQLSAQVKVSKAIYKENKSKLYPRVNLKIEHQWGNFNNLDAKTENRIFINLISDFGAGLSNFSQIRQAELEERASLFELESAKNTLKQQFKTNWLTYHSLIKQKRLLNDALSAQQKIQKSWYRQFLVGKKSWQDVMNATREVSQLESQLSDAIAESILTSWGLAIRINGVNKI